MSFKDGAISQAFTLSFALLLLNLFTHLTWSYGGSWMAKKFASNYAVQLQSKVFGVMLILIAIWLLVYSL